MTPHLYKKLPITSNIISNLGVRNKNFEALLHFEYGDGKFQCKKIQRITYDTIHIKSHALKLFLIYVYHFCYKKQMHS